MDRSSLIILIVSAAFIVGALIYLFLKKPDKDESSPYAPGKSFLPEDEESRRQLLETIKTALSGLRTREGQQDFLEKNSEVINRYMQFQDFREGYQRIFDTYGID